MTADTSENPSTTAGRPAATSPQAVEQLARQLIAQAGQSFAGLAPAALQEAWDAAIGELLDPHSAIRRRLDPDLAANVSLAPAALTAALDAMLAGFVGEPARQVIERGHAGRTSESRPAALTLAVVAGNIPGLAVQVALPALAAGRPLLIKSPSSEPLFAAALVDRLACHEPALADVIAAVNWQGGDAAIEGPVLGLTETLIAFGDAETLADLRRRFVGRQIELGPKLSIAVVSADADPSVVGRQLATDVALFEQRGCLSVQTVFTDGSADALARALATGLEELAERWPPPALDPALAARIQQLRHLTELTGGRCLDLPPGSGTILVAPPASATNPPTLEPLPGGRTVRIQPIEALPHLPTLLEPWRGIVQGAAIAGAAAWALSDELTALGVTRLASPGTLQRPDALWANGDEHLLDSLLR